MASSRSKDSKFWDMGLLSRNLGGSSLKNSVTWHLAKSKGHVSSTISTLGGLKNKKR